MLTPTEKIPFLVTSGGKLLYESQPHTFLCYILPFLGLNIDIYTYIKIFVIVQPTIFLKNNFKVTCYNMLKHLKNSIFLENFTFL